MERGRCPLNALPPGRLFAFPPADTLILDKLEDLAGGRTPAILQLDTSDFAALLPALAGHPNVWLGKTSAVTVTRTPLPLPLRATLEPGGEIVLAMTEEVGPMVRIGSWVWRKPALQPLVLPPALAEVLRAPVRLSRRQVPQFLGRDWPQLHAAGAVQANFKLEDFTLEPQAPRFLLEFRAAWPNWTRFCNAPTARALLTVGAPGVPRLAARPSAGFEETSRVQPGAPGAAENVWLPDR